MNTRELKCDLEEYIFSLRESLIFTYEETLGFCPNLSREKFEEERKIVLLLVERGQPLIDSLDEMMDYEEGS